MPYICAAWQQKQISLTHKNEGMPKWFMYDTTKRFTRSEKYIYMTYGNIFFLQHNKTDAFVFIPSTAVSIIIRQGSLIITKQSSIYGFNTLRARQNARHFPDVIFKCILLNENIFISIKNSLKFVPMCPINNITALVQTTSHHLNQWWLVYRCIYASFSLDNPNKPLTSPIRNTQLPRASKQRGYAL